MRPEKFHEAGLLPFHKYFPNFKWILAKKSGIKIRQLSFHTKKIREILNGVSIYGGTMRV